MRTTDRLRFDCASCVLEFCRRYPDPTQAATAAVARLEHLLPRAAVLLEQQLLAQQAAESALRERDGIVDGMRERLTHLVRFAATTAAHEHEDALKLKIPRGTCSQLQFLAAAWAAVATATKHQVLMHRYGMPAELLDELGRDLDRYRAVQERRADALAAGVRANAEIVTLAKRAMVIIRHLDALNRFRFAGDPERLAEWQVARSIAWQRGRAPGPARRNPAPVA